jgi:ppGpp synthetase/RelA/SpoT-type nucleotidyltranferase
MGTESSKTNRKDFLERHRLSEDAFVKAGLAWLDLDEIAESHALETPNLHATANHVTQLLQNLPEVHSVKVRILDTEELIERIIRMKLETPAMTVSRANYREQVTDLIAIRALYLLKEQWKPIHEFVTTTWDLGGKPTAYVRDSDPETAIQVFREAGCDVEQHPFGYRSVRYLVESRPTKYSYTSELLVRTMFEEACTEIDHEVRYPGASDNPVLAHFMTTFSQLSDRADEMGSFIKALSVHAAEQARRRSDLESRLRQTIKQLNISEKDRNQLQQQIDELRSENAFPKLTPEPVARFKSADQPLQAREPVSVGQTPKVVTAEVRGTEEPKGTPQAPTNGPIAAGGTGNVQPVVPQASANGPRVADGPKLAEGPKAADGPRAVDGPRAADATQAGDGPRAAPQAASRAQKAEALHKPREAFEVKPDRRICSRCGQPFMLPPGFEMAAQPVCASCMSR